MASPQKENGYTAIANELLEAIISFPFNASQYKIVLSVIRKTYGYNKKEDWISNSQFISMTKLNARTIRRELSRLRKMKVLSAKGIEKNWERWEGDLVIRIYPAFKKVVDNAIRTGDFALVGSYLNGQGGGSRCPGGEGRAVRGGRVCGPPTKDNITKDNNTKDKYQPPAASRPVDNSKDQLLKEALDRARSFGLNIYALLGQLRRERGWPAGKMFPAEVLLDVCRDFEARKDRIKRPWPYFKKVLALACDRWSAEDQIRESAIFKQEPVLLTIEGILAMAGKIGEGNGS